MPRAGSRPLANGQQESYCRAVARGESKKEALLSAGYASSAHGQSYMIEQRAGVADRREFLQNELKEKMFRVAVVKATVTRDQLNSKAEEIFRIAMEGRPLIGKGGKCVEFDTGERDDEGNVVMEGIRTRDLPSAVRSIEVQAKLNGLCVDVSVQTDNLDSLLDGKTNEELAQKFEGLVAEIDPNLKKKLREKAALENEAEEAGENTPTEIQSEEEPTLQ